MEFFKTLLGEIPSYKLMLEVKNTRKLVFFIMEGGGIDLYINMMYNRNYDRCTL